MKVRDIIKLLEQDGWYLKATRGIIANTSPNEAWTRDFAGTSKR